MSSHWLNVPFYPWKGTLQCVRRNQHEIEEVLMIMVLDYGQERERERESRRERERSNSKLRLLCLQQFLKRKKHTQKGMVNYRVWKDECVCRKKRNTPTLVDSVTCPSKRCTNSSFNFQFFVIALQTLISHWPHSTGSRKPRLLSRLFPPPAAEIRKPYVVLSSCTLICFDRYQWNL